MLRGINQQIIFYDDEDRKKFIAILERYKEEENFELCAWCLMSNHVHLVIRANSPETLMKKVGVSYVYYFNTKHGRSGHLFQDRYRSEAVEKESYMLTVIRYVHMNPVRAGIVERPGDYGWSSFRDYLFECGVIKNDAGLFLVTDTSMLLGTIGKENFVSYSREPNDDKCMDVAELESKKHVTDAEALEIFYKVTGCNDVEDFKFMEREEKYEAIGAMLRAKIGIWQITRITGLSRRTVQKAARTTSRMTARMAVR